MHNQKHLLSAPLSRRRMIGGASVAVVALSALRASPAAARSMDSSVCDLRSAMRKLWEDHITWTRVYIIDALAGLGDTDAAAGRLLNNQEDIGAAIVPFYGAAAGGKLTELLKEHIMIATEVLKAAKASDTAGVTAQQQRWSANADEIAVFLSEANPAWPRATVRDGLQKHLDFTTQEVVSRLQSNWAADIAAYDANHDHMLMFSDMLTDGIVQQFPAKFNSGERG